MNKYNAYIHLRRISDVLALLTKLIFRRFDRSWLCWDHGWDP